LPQGGHYVAGSGSIAQNGANLSITQSGSRGIIEWNDFSIGSGHTVSINNGTGATLNRVRHRDPVERPLAGGRVADAQCGALAYYRTAGEHSQYGNRLADAVRR
jgi:hypothetical protein